MLPHMATSAEDLKLLSVVIPARDEEGCIVSTVRHLHLGGLYQTALQPGELVTSVRFRVPQRAAYIKYKQPASRFALVGVFVSQWQDGVRVAVTGAKATVFRAGAIERALEQRFAPEAAKAIRLPLDDINGDLHGSARYRASMISVMAGRAVAAALAR